MYIDVHISYKYVEQVGMFLPLVAISGIWPAKTVKLM
jgi:hypothetical protein